MSTTRMITCHYCGGNEQRNHGERLCSSCAALINTCVHCTHHVMDHLRAILEPDFPNAILCTLDKCACPGYESALFALQKATA